MFSDALLITSKELRNLFRDKRTIFTSLVLPLLLFPIVFGIIGFIAKLKSQENESTKFTVYVENYSENDLIVEELKRSGKFDVVLGKIEDDLIEKEPTNLGLIVESKNGKFSVTIVYNSLREKGDYGAQRLKELLTNLNNALVSSELIKRGINPKELNFIDVKEKITGVKEEDSEKARAKSSFTQMLAGIVPYFLLIYLFSGSMGLGIDVTTGEKERGSLAILLVNQVSRTSIALGKMLYLMLMSTITGTLDVIGFIIGIYVQMKFLSSEDIPFVVDLNSVQYFGIFVSVILLALLAAGIVILAGSLARSVKEAGGYVTPIYLIVLVVGISTMQSEGAKPIYQYAIPILNVIYTMKDFFIGTYTFSRVMLMVIVNSLIIVSLVYLVARVFNSEKVLEVNVD